MSRLKTKYYILIALVLITFRPGKTPDTMREWELWNKIKQALIGVFYADNPMFDQKKFNDYIDNHK